MTSLKTAAVSGCLALAGMLSLLAPAARASDWDKKTIVTFPHAVEIPAVHVKGYGILPAGTYVFKLVNSNADRNIVQIFDKDEKTIYATILAISAYRLTPAEKTYMTFSERPAGEPEALKTWFVQGDNFGREFVYHRPRAVEVAKTTNTTVYSTTTELPNEVEKISTDDSEYTKDLMEAQVAEVQPSEDMQVSENQQVEVAQNTPAPEPAPVTTATETRLPSTASYIPLMGLIGILALGAGLMIPYRRL